MLTHLDILNIYLCYSTHGQRRMCFYVLSSTDGVILVAKGLGGKEIPLLCFLAPFTFLLKYSTIK